jgi:hypothetical protein
VRVPRNTGGTPLFNVARVEDKYGGGTRTRGTNVSSLKRSESVFISEDPGFARSTYDGIMNLSEPLSQCSSGNLRGKCLTNRL